MILEESTESVIGVSWQADAWNEFVAKREKSGLNETIKY
jgi:hypothetical protein